MQGEILDYDAVRRHACHLRQAGKQLRLRVRHTVKKQVWRQAGKHFLRVKPLRQVKRGQHGSINLAGMLPEGGAVIVHEIEAGGSVLSAGKKLKYVVAVLGIAAGQGVHVATGPGFEQLARGPGTLASRKSGLVATMVELPLDHENSLLGAAAAFRAYGRQWISNVEDAHAGNDYRRV